jgi:T5SS/PEP-CTERM-associated repeat protein
MIDVMNSKMRISLAGLALAGALVVPGYGDTRVWLDPSDGDFDDPANWLQTSSPPTIPGGGDLVRFNRARALGEPYVVSFPGSFSPSTARLSLDPTGTSATVMNVVFDLSASDYKLTATTGEPALRIGEEDGDLATLTLRNGDLMTPSAVVGQSLEGGSRGNGDLTVGADARLITDSTVTIGHEGNGQFSVIDGGLAELNNNNDTNGLIIGDAQSSLASTIVNEGELVVGGDLVAGLGGYADFSIINDGSATADELFAGAYSTGSGDVLVRGENSTLEVGNNAALGVAGNGDLTVSEGGRFVLNPTDAAGGTYQFDLGEATVGRGTATITGAGSEFEVNGQVRVGDLGDGQLTVEAGAAGESRNLVVGSSAGGLGEVAIAGEDTTYETEGNVSIGIRGEGTLTVQDGATLTANTTRASSRGLIIAAEAGGRSTVDIDGGLAEIKNSTYVGYRDVGQLNITNGGVLETSEGWVGQLNGGQGAVTIDGDGSRWESSGRVYVGGIGDGTLTLTNQAAMAIGGSGEGLVIGQVAGSSGHVVVDGSDIENPQRTDIVIGKASTDASLVSRAGSYVAGGSIVIGQQDGSAGEATATSDFATIDADDELIVGGQGEGILNIDQSGRANADQRVIIAEGINSTGTVNIFQDAQLTSQGDIEVGGNSASADPVGGQGQINVYGEGLLFANDTLRLWDNGTVNLAGGAVSVADIEFAGSTFNFNAGLLEFTGDAQLTPDKLDNIFGGYANLQRGQHLKARGELTLSDNLALEGGELTADRINNPSLFNYQAGTLNITDDNGLTVSPLGMVGQSLVLGTPPIEYPDEPIGDGPYYPTPEEVGGPQHLTVYAREAGESSEVTVTTAGTVTIYPGSSLSSNTINNRGVVRLMGAGAQINGRTGNSALNNRNLLIGAGRIATNLNNEASGFVRVESGERMTVSKLMTNHGNVVIRNDSELYVNPGADLSDPAMTNLGNITIGQGGGELFAALRNTTDGRISVGNASQGRFFGSVDNQGQIIVSEGSQAIFHASVTGAGDFPGSGRVQFNDGFSPGNSPGEVSFGGDLSLASAAVLLMELAGDDSGSEFDHLNVTGALTAGGTLDLTLLDGFSPEAGQSFDLFDAATIDGQFATLDLPSLDSGLQWDEANLYSTGEITAVPEPGSLVLLGLTTIIALHSRQGRRAATC